MASESTQLGALLASAAELGDDDAYEKVIEHAVDRLMALTRRMLRSYPHLHRWEQTDDVFQEGAIRLCRALRDLRPRSVEELFALAALQVRRTLIDLSRHHFGPLGPASHHHSDQHLLESATSYQVPSDATKQTGEPQSMLGWTEFHEAVGGLPPEERKVFEFIWYGGTTYEEAAHLLGVTRRTAIRRMNAARLRLKSAVVGVVE